MNDLAARKRLLLAEADLHRQLVGLERQRLGVGCGSALSLLQRSRWWLVGGAVLAGLLFVRQGRAVVRWLPTIIALCRITKA